MAQIITQGSHRIVDKGISLASKHSRLADAMFEVPPSRRNLSFPVLVVLSDGIAKYVCLRLRILSGKEGIYLIRPP